jgi:hypothetical protein
LWIATVNVFNRVNVRLDKFPVNGSRARRISPDDQRPT